MFIMISVMFCKNTHAYRRIKYKDNVWSQKLYCLVNSVELFVVGISPLDLIELLFVIEKIIDRICWVGISFGVHFCDWNFIELIEIVLLDGPPQK